MPQSLPPRATGLLLALVLALLVLRLGAVPLLGPDEPRYARVAVEMQRNGEWVTPTLQGEPWLEKPPLYYWLAGAAFHVLGETEAAARAPSVLALLLLTGTAALVGARLYGSAAGLHAGFVAGTSLLTFAYGRAASMDTGPPMECPTSTICWLGMAAAAVATSWPNFAIDQSLRLASVPPWPPRSTVTTVYFCLNTGTCSRQ